MATRQSHNPEAVSTGLVSKTIIDQFRTRRIRSARREQTSCSAISEHRHSDPPILNSLGRMMLTFVCVRVSTAGQSVENQIAEIEAAGYQPDAVFSEVVSGSVPAMKRPEFAAMVGSIERTRTPKRLIVSKLDRLGRDAGDVIATVKQLSGIGCSVKVLALGDLDLTTTAGKLVLTTLAAVSELERDLLIERTHSGLARARRDGKRLGRPRLLKADQVSEVRAKLQEGVAVAAVAREFDVSRATVIRAREGSDR